MTRIRTSENDMDKDIRHLANTLPSAIYHIAEEIILSQVGKAKIGLHVTMFC